MKVEIEEDAEVNVDSLWIIGPRAKGGKRDNDYHGNFVPQIPSDLIRRFTSVGDIVIEPFAGSGTTLFECERLARKYIGFDINKEIVDAVESKMNDGFKDYSLHLEDSASEKVERSILNDLARFGKQQADLLLIHPPYFDIIKFTKDKRDLSNSRTMDEFLGRYVSVLDRFVSHIKKNGHLAIVAGDIYRNSEVVPLGFLLMDVTRRNFNCKLKGIIIKDMVGNRAKIGLNALWRKRALKSDYYLFKHEYVFVFRKMN